MIAAVSGWSLAEPLVLLLSRPSRLAVSDSIMAVSIVVTVTVTLASWDAVMTMSDPAATVSVTIKMWLELDGA